MKNTIQLLGHYGSDETHSLSAWTSTSRDIEEKRHRIPALLDKLAKEGHHTPFEKSAIHFLVDCDIATHIHLIKHRVSVSVNAESARYKELKEDKFYIPEDWKAGHESVGFDTTLNKWSSILESYSMNGNKLYHDCLEQLTPILGRKRAKESARFFKTYNSQIAADVQFNFRSFMHFQQLRNSEHAQLEIREVAQEMLRLVQQIPGNPFQHSLKAFGYE